MLLFYEMDSGNAGSESVGSSCGGERPVQKVYFHDLITANYCLITGTYFLCGDYRISLNGNVIVVTCTGTKLCYIN